MQMHEVQEKVLALVADHAFEHDPTGITPDTHLIRSGILDSMAVVELADSLRNTFGILLPDERVQPRNFSTVRDIVRLVEDERGATGEES